MNFSHFLLHKFNLPYVAWLSVFTSNICLALYYEDKETIIFLQFMTMILLIMRQNGRKKRTKRAYVRPKLTRLKDEIGETVWTFKDELQGKKEEIHVMFYTTKCLRTVTNLLENGFFGETSKKDGLLGNGIYVHRNWSRRPKETDDFIFKLFVYPGKSLCMKDSYIIQQYKDSWVELGYDSVSNEQQIFYIRDGHFIQIVGLCQVYQHQFEWLPNKLKQKAEATKIKKKCEMDGQHDLYQLHKFLHKLSFTEIDIKKQQTILHEIDHLNSRRIDSDVQQLESSALSDAYSDMNTAKHDLIKHIGNTDRDGIIGLIFNCTNTKDQAILQYKKAGYNCTKFDARNDTISYGNIVVPATKGYFDDIESMAADRNEVNSDIIQAGLREVRGQLGSGSEDSSWDVPLEDLEIVESSCCSEEEEG